MKINKETALRIWNKQMGKQNKGRDFAGREIAKAAYNDRRSKYGWNVDHIKPESLGGKTTDYNLICCHILTNDEKADRFPNFKANGKSFQIHKRENHYEIFEQNNNSNKDMSYDDGNVNFFDATQGVKFWNQCVNIEDDYWIGYVNIKVTIPSDCEFSSSSFYYFFEDLFPNTSIFMKNTNNNIGWYRQNDIYIFTIIDSHIYFKDDIQNLLDSCILLNTYSKNFFLRKYNINMNIYCGLNTNQAATDLHSYDDILNKRLFYNYTLAIDDLIIINTDAKNNFNERVFKSCFYEYDYTYTKLEKNLNKMFK